MNFIEIQSWPEIPSIGYFVSLFSSSFNLPDFDIEDLEEALLLDSSENTSIDDSTTAELAPRLIPELIVSLLRGCDLVKSWPNITTSNYQMFLRRLFRHKCEEYAIENPFNTDTDFHCLSLRTKVVILNYLCDFRLDSADLDSVTSQFEADSLRIEPLGYDANGSAYWYFFGTRLYREDFPKNASGSVKKAGERIWQVICFTEQDWQNLTNKFRQSKSRKESALYKALVEDFLPSIPVLFKAKEAERRRRLFQRRSSVRVKSIIERRKEKQAILGEDLPEVYEEEDPDNKLSHSERYEQRKKKEVQVKSQNREKVQQERALRAQRRSSSISSSVSSKSSFNLSFDSFAADDCCSHDSSSARNSKNCLSNKENILHTNLDIMDRKPNSAKMPPISTKLPGRQTNNSLSSITGQIMIDTPPRNSPGPSTSRKKKVKVDDFMETDELQIGMHKVLQHIKNHDDAWPFMDPVEEDIAPRYYSIIKRPMDLLKMEEKLENGEYRTLSEFRTDFKLIVNNCRLYNGQNNEYTEMVNNLQQAFERSSRKYFDSNSSDEEPVLLEYPPIEPVQSRVITGKEKESKKEKVKVKDKKHSKQLPTVRSSEDEGNDDVEDEKPPKKHKDTKHSASSEKILKKSTRSNSSEKKKEKSTKGVKRKHKDKDKLDKPKSKKIKRDVSVSKDTDYNSEKSENDDSEDETHQPIYSNKNNKKSTPLEIPSSVKPDKKTKKNEKIKQNSAKKPKKEQIVESVKSVSPEVKKKSKKVPQLKEKFSKTNAKANSKKLKVEKIPEPSDSDDDSVHDLIEEKKEIADLPKTGKKSKNKTSPDVLKVPKKKHTSSSTPKKHSSKSKKNGKKTAEDFFSMSSGSFSRSPSPLPSINSSALTDDLNNSFEYESSKNSKRKLDLSFRSDTPEIKDKFDLIKERRNKINQEKEEAKTKGAKKDQTVPKNKEKNHKLKGTIEKLKLKNEKSKNQVELMDEVLGGKTMKKEENSLFDRLKNEEVGVEDKNAEGNDEGQSKSKKSKAEKKESKSSSSKKKSEEKSVPASSNDVPQTKTKKQNKACLDVLDMETEQTLKDINKWLEHTPRFEYSSASNSPSRYIIDEIDMPSNDDFRKPIPLMPSSPSASHTNFQSPQNTSRDFNLLKESNNNKQSSSLQHNAGVPSTSSKKPSTKETKRKSLKEKLQQLPKKKEVQRTIDRLQPGKTKGNLLHNIQNINKPEELFPLGSRDKIKEVKNSLIVQTDESSPKLSLGTVLDTQSFNFTDAESKKTEERFEPSSATDATSKKDSLSEPDFAVEKDQLGESSSAEVKDELKDTSKGAETPPSENSKPNLNAWFKAFGVPKKPKKSESEELGKHSDSEPMKAEISYMPTHQRRLSTGSSVSERSSGSSPQVGLEERLGAPAPYPSPIGASPVMASPKTEDQRASSSNYPVNGSNRVGFYQDMTSKSSPEKSCSPREMPSPYGQYNQQNIYSNPSSSPGLYGNFYNPENSSANKQGQQASYSKPTSSPASYYDQYKQPMSQESEFNNSMSPSTNPNSPYHSQQSSPYQQQPNSPFQAGTGSNQAGANQSSSNTNLSQAPNSPYSQPSSPYQQPSQQPQSTSPFHQSTPNPTTTAQPQSTAPQSQTTPFNNQSSPFPQIASNQSFNQHNPSVDQFSTSNSQQNCAKAADWSNKTNNASNPTGSYGLAAQLSTPPFNVASHQSQPNLQNVQNSQNSSVIGNHHSNLMLNSENTFSQGQGSFNKKNLIDNQASAAPASTPIYGARKIPDMSGSSYTSIDAATKSAANLVKDSKQNESAKYLDLSKQQSSHMNQLPPGNNQSNQYQQMFDLQNYSKASLEFDLSKNKSAEMFNKSLQKTNAPPVTASPPCSAGPGFWGNSNPNKAQDMAQAYGGNQSDVSKMDLSTKTPINSMQANSFLNNPISHQSSRNTQPPPMDINYKQPLFNNPAASSMMDLTAFMRDFRQAEERYSNLSGATSSFYDKNITPAHMFGKNLQQTNSSAALQQMFNNSMTTMAYNREQQNMNLASYHNRINTPQGVSANTTPAHTTHNVAAAETKAKKQRKKKNASPEASMNIQAQNTSQHPQQSLHHSQHQQQLAHQPGFQSYGGLKIPSATPGSADPSAISLKSIVPGSAFNYGPTPLSGLYGENPAYLDEFRSTTNPYYPPPGLGHRSTPDPTVEKATGNPPPAHPQAPSSPYHHLLPPHHPSRSSYPFMNSIDPATLQQQYRMMLNQTYQAGYHPALGMHNQPPHWPHM